MKSIPRKIKTDESQVEKKKMCESESTFQKLKLKLKSPFGTSIPKSLMHSPTSLILLDSSCNMTSFSAEQNLDVGGGGGIDCIPLTFCDVASIYANEDIRS